MDVGVPRDEREVLTLLHDKLSAEQIEGAIRAMFAKTAAANPDERRTLDRLQKRVFVRLQAATLVAPPFPASGACPAARMAGASERAIQRQTGHKSLEMLRRPKVLEGACRILKKKLRPVVVSGSRVYPAQERPIRSQPWPIHFWHESTRITAAEERVNQWLEHAPAHCQIAA